MRLTLRKDTLVELGRRDLAGVVGGAPISADCTAWPYGCTVQSMVELRLSELFCQSWHTEEC